MFKAFKNRMKCFTYFKDRTRHKDQKSAPTLQNRTGWTTSDDVGRGGTRSSGSANSPRGIPELYRAKAGKLRVFSYPELRDAAAGFSSLWKIGEGGFGCVYKGSVRPVGGGGGEPMVVAIKKLNKDGFQGHKQWVAEVQFLGVVDHPNLVKLVGYCAVDGERSIQRLLVYEFMPNKSLEDHLFKNSHEVLSWERRLQIMLGAAQGLAYLHEELEAQVIFRDFKASNILLDDDFNPKLSDFGLAREGPTEGQTHVSTAVMGTHGYAAPDYIETGHLTSKSDVWSFGVVLYEVLTGRRSLERDRNRPRHVQTLLDWVRRHPVGSNKFPIVLDPRLDGGYSLAAAREVARLADRCLVKSAKDRPKMSQVVERLKQISEMPPDDGGSPPETAGAGEEPRELTGKSKAAERRFAQLTKLSEHVGGVGKRGFMILRRAEVL